MVKEDTLKGSDHHKGIEIFLRWLGLCACLLVSLLAGCPLPFRGKRKPQTKPSVLVQHAHLPARVQFPGRRGASPYSEFIGWQGPEYPKPTFNALVRDVLGLVKGTKGITHLCQALILFKSGGPEMATVSFWFTNRKKSAPNGPPGALAQIPECQALMRSFLERLVERHLRHSPPPRPKQRWGQRVPFKNGVQRSRSRFLPQECALGACVKT